MEMHLVLARKLLISSFALVLFLGIGVFLFVTKPWLAFVKKEAPKSEVKVLTYQDDKFKFKVQYPEGFVLGKISPESQVKDPVMLKLVRQEPPTLVLVWQEGLGMVGAFVKKPLLQHLRENIDRRYGSEYRDFKKEKVEDATLAGLPAFTVWFSFQDPQKTYREKMMFTATVIESKGYYLQCQAPEAMWDYAEPSCNLIKANFEFLP